MRYDRIIIGAGLYGMYAAVQSARKGYRVLILERENNIFSRATSVNQARVHSGMHYPRSTETAEQCEKYYERFIRDHQACINRKYDAVYAIAAHDSYVDAGHFEKMLGQIGIAHREIDPGLFFSPGTVAAAYKIEECCFDYRYLQEYYLKMSEKYSGRIDLLTGYAIRSVELTDNECVINGTFRSPYLLNATYASVNQVINRVSGQLFRVKYELCEVALCSVPRKYENVGITIMDGRFFSIMPFGHSEYHSLTTVCHTPHQYSDSALPAFDCQRQNRACTLSDLDNCNSCPARPPSQYEVMQSMASAFLLPDFRIRHRSSLYAVKPVLKSTENDDARPTVIVKHSDCPVFYSVLSGKISTVYELDAILE